MLVESNNTRYFIFVFAVLMCIGAHYFQHNLGGSGLRLPQNNVVWILFSCLIGLGLWEITIQKKVFYSRFTLIIFIAFLCFLVPTIYQNNEDISSSYPRLLGMLAGFLLYLSLQQLNLNRKQLQHILLLIVVAGFLQALYSLMQDYLLPANNYFGYDVGFGRPYGIFQQPNVLASFMATTLILSGYLLQLINYKKIHIFLYINSLLTSWVIFLCMSRTGYLGVLIALLLISPWSWKNQRKRLGLFLLALVLGCTFASIKGDALQARNIQNLDEGGERVVFYEHCLQMIKKQPIYGYGYGSFEKHFLLSHAPRAYKGDSNYSSNIVTHPHNDLLFWAVEGGIVPVFAIIILAVCFLQLLRTQSISKASTYLALTIPISLHTQTEYPLYQSALHWFVLLVLVFYIDKQVSVINNKTFKPTFALRSIAIMIPLFCSIFMVTNLYTISKLVQYERSKSSKVELLQSVINPFVFQDYLELNLSMHRLYIASKHGNRSDMEEVMNWALERVNKTHKNIFYIALSLTYSELGNLEKAQKTLERGIYLYPKDKNLADLKKDLALSDS